MPVESELLEEFDISALGNNAKEPQVESELLGEFDPSDLIKVRNAKKLDDAINRTVGDKDREAFNRVDWYTEHIPFFKQVKDAVVGVAGATAQPRESEQRNQRGEIVNAPQDGSSLSTKANAAYKRITESPEDALDSDFDVIAQATAKGVWNAPKGWKDYVGHTVADRKSVV